MTGDCLGTGRLTTRGAVTARGAHAGHPVDRDGLIGAAGQGGLGGPDEAPKHCEDENKGFHNAPPGAVVKTRLACRVKAARIVV